MTEPGNISPAVFPGMGFVFVGAGKALCGIPRNITLFGYKSNHNRPGILKAGAKRNIMKIKGIAATTKQLEALQDIVQNKIDAVNWNRHGAEDLDERLNAVWDILEEAKDGLKNISKI